MKGRKMIRNNGMFFVAVALAIGLMIVLSGCGGSAVVRGMGDYETAQFGGGWRMGDANEVEAGLLCTWWEKLPDETVGAKAYGLVRVDPNTLGAFGLGGDWEVPLGAEVRVGAYIGTDFEVGGVLFGPVVSLDLLPQAALCPSIWYEYATYGKDLADEEGFNDEHKVFFGAVYVFPK